MLAGLFVATAAVDAASKMYEGLFVLTKHYRVWAVLEKSGADIAFHCCAS